MNKRTGILVILTIFLLAALFVAFLKVKQTDSIWVKIEGKITPTQKTINEYQTKKELVLSYRPDKVSIKEYKYSLNERKSGGKLFKWAHIEWKDDLNGIYETEVELPLAMSLFIEAGYGNYRTIKVTQNKEKIKVDITWEKVEEENELPILNIENQINRNEELETFLREDILKADFQNESYGEEIQKEILEARRQTSEAKSAKDDLTKIKKLAYGEWFLWRGNFKVEYYQLMECNNKINNLISKFNSLFFDLPFEAKEGFKTFSNVLEVFPPNKRNMDPHRIFHYENLTDIKQQTNNILRERSEIMRYTSECNSKLNPLKSNYEYQESILKQKILFLLIIIILSFLIGLFIEYKKGIIRKYIKKQSQNINNYKEKFISFSNSIKIDDKKTGTILITACGAIFLFDGTVLFQSTNLNPTIKLNLSISLFLALASLFTLILSNLVNQNRCHKLRFYSCLGIMASIVSIFYFSLIKETILSIIFLIFKSISWFIRLFIKS